MTATTKTWRNMQQMHRIFAVSGVVLLIATVWMLVADHRRQWKSIQRTGDKLQSRSDTWRQIEFRSQSHPARQLQAAVEQRRSSYIAWYGYLPLPGKKLLELPLLDAFNSPRKIETLWSEDLTVDYNLVQVPRYDRCTTCHQLMEKTVPGGRNQPAYPPEQSLEFVIAALAEGTPDDEEAASSSVERLSRIWGLHLAEDELLRPGDVLVQYVWPDSPAARASRRNPLVEGTATGRAIRESLLQPSAGSLEEVNPPRGLVMGDVLVTVNGQQVVSLAGVRQQLLAAADAGESLVLGVRRGVPNPYAAHPRLDLFVGSLSPHPMSPFGCTVCHAGQGSGTEFRWASHVPSDEAERHQWRKAYGWFDNPDWPYPMLPRRFAQSACLKCHHDVVDLQPTMRFPVPPAPKLVRGYELIRNYGCFGCHEIQGFRGLHRIGPDLRPEPNSASLALQLQNDPGFAKWDETSQAWVRELIQNPQLPEPRRRIEELLQADAAAASPVLTSDTRQRLTPLWKEQPQPGDLRPVGPSLRAVVAKLQPPFLYEWIRSPRSIRPTTRMPHSFGLWDHLDEQGRGGAQRFESLEILGMVTYLLGRSETFDYVTPDGAATGSTAAEKAARGKVVFQERGCLACHTHRDFPDAEAYRARDEIVQGPDLSDLAGKLAHENGRRWLYSWVKQPTRYHPRTLMPQTFLDPVEHADGAVTDPAADVVEYLLTNSQPAWQPDAQTLAALGPLDAVRQQVLHELTIENLRDTFSQGLAEQLATRGVPADLLRETAGAETELARPVAASDEAFIVSTDQKLRYVGRKSLARYGCAGCHDIPGLEDAKPIGPALSDWGRKDEHQLAFESIVPYLEGVGATGRPRLEEIPGFYLHQIRSGHRAGFAYQKIREPRGYDFRRTENKRYTERLRMPQFQFSEADREAIITFLLGLVANPPAERYVYQPNAEHRAWIDGRRVLDNYRCQTCHVLDAQQWRIAFPPGDFGPQPEVARYPFLDSRLPRELLAASASPDSGGLARTVVWGKPALDRDGFPLVLDEDGLPLDDEDSYDRAGLEYPLELWRPAAVDGQTYEVGVLPLNVGVKALENVRAADGGFLAKYLLPHVVRRERENNPAAKGSEAWGWLPPPLLNEGRKVQTGWLHDFLLNPTPIRPAAVMRMPRYNLSAEEAAALVRYFASVDGVDFPYESRLRRQADYLTAAQQRYEAALSGDPEASNNEVRTRLGDALRIVQDANFCVKCHRVGRFEPEIADRAKGPDLAQVYLRLRPEYLRDWIADPKTLLPYTGMPINIPYDPTRPDLGAISQELYHGNSLEQLEALVDLLMNFDQHVLRQTPISP